MTEVLLKLFGGVGRGFYLTMSPATRTSYFFQRLKESLEEAIASDECTGVLIDSSIPIDKRTIIFYLDLWHGKNFPYDDRDVISQHLPTP